MDFLKKNMTIKLVLLLLVASSIIACSASKKVQKESKNEEIITSVKSEENLKGKILFRNYCVVCHGIEGDLNSVVAANLKISTLTLEERIKVITEGRNLMTPFEGLFTKGEIENIADYIEVLRN
ncbi:MAG: cytochrome c [Saprospiraceae bacterium]